MPDGDESMQVSGFQPQTPTMRRAYLASCYLYPFSVSCEERAELLGVLKQERKVGGREAGL